MLELIVNGALACLTPVNILAMLLSVPLGIIIGALPGFGAATGLIIILPLTYSIAPGTALIALVGVYIGAEYGGSISSILLNTPGTGGAVVTCFDGFPMAKQGRAREALFISNIASFSGGIVSGLSMLLCMSLLGNFILKFGAGEIFVLAALGLFLVGSISKGDPLKGIASAAGGVFMTCIGADAFLGNPRFDFGFDILLGGLPFIPTMLGVFSVPHLLSMVLGGSKLGTKIEFENKSFGETTAEFVRVFRDMAAHLKMLLLRSGIIGVLVGIVPGVGASVATMISYAAAKKSSKEPEKFGKGSVEGVASAESCNNGLVGGSLIPVLALGIPGSPSAAIFMGAIFMQGMVPGPNFMSDQADLVYLLIMSVFFCALVQLLIGYLSIGSLANVLKITPDKLFPTVLVICSIGAYVVRGLPFDIGLFCVFGIVAYFLMRIGFNPGAFVLGMILGTVTERSMLEAMTIAHAMGGVGAYLHSRPIAATMLAIFVVYAVWRLWLAWKGSRKNAARVAAGGTIPGLLHGQRGADLLLGIGGLLFCAFFFYHGRDLVFKTALFPYIVLTIIGGSMLMILVRAVSMRTAYVGMTTSPFAGVPLAKIVGIAVTVIFYLWGINYVGFYAASFVVVAMLTNLLLYYRDGACPSRAILRNIAFAAVFTVAAYVIFNICFGTITPAEYLP